uniref:Uncharacterized protein n=1 Tax=Arundo donax TaxID=35708 RepID=A0A0A9FLX9_ARUDO
MVEEMQGRRHTGDGRSAGQFNFCSSSAVEALLAHDGLTGRGFKLKLPLR